MLRNINKPARHARSVDLIRSVETHKQTHMTLAGLFILLSFSFPVVLRISCRTQNWDPNLVDLWRDPQIRSFQRPFQERGVRGRSWTTCAPRSALLWTCCSSSMNPAWGWAMLAGLVFLREQPRPHFCSHSVLLTLPVTHHDVTSRSSPLTLWLLPSSQVRMTG